MLDRLPELPRREPLLIVMAVFAAAGYSLYAIWEHNHFLTDFDLAIADQAVWNYSLFQEPTITSIPPEAVNMLGDHFSPILAALAPLYWIWEDPRMLLIAQGVLIAASIVPVFLFARERLGRLGAYLLCGGYALFWGVQAAVGFQFHELAFAPLLIALCVLFADRREWTAFFVSLAALLLVKENMSVLTVFIGLWLLSGREVRMGLVTIGAGLAWYALSINVFIPAFAGGEEYTHWTYTDFGPDAPSAVGEILTHPHLPFTALVDESEKVRTLALLFLPFLALTFASRLIILCIPLVAQQMFSSYEAQWGTEFHYWLPIAPILAMGAADGLRNLVGWLGRERSLAVAGTAVGGVILVANLFLVAREQPVGDAYDTQITGIPALGPLRPGFSLSATDADRVNQGVVNAIPNDASVTAAAPLAPHLSNRDEIYLLGYEAPSTDYVAFAPAAVSFPDPEFAQEWLDQRRSDYRQVYRDGTWMVWRRLG